MASLYLIPTVLSDSPLDNVLPSNNADVIRKVKVFIVENIRTARRFLKQVDKSINKNFDYIKQLLVNIPEKPGVYEYFDESEKILYVGKARNLKRRVSSYFSHFNDLSPKIRILVRKICNIKYIVLENEIDALFITHEHIDHTKGIATFMNKTDIPIFTSKFFIASPDRSLIFASRNELRALVASNPFPPPLALGDRYMPVVSIATAARPRSSMDMEASSFCTVRSSGACRVNSKPRSDRV